MNSEESKIEIGHVQFRDLDISTNESSISFETRKIDTKRDRYPCSIVWTSIPGLTHCLPFIGHTGICTRDRVIHDFAGPYTVTVDNLAFGRPQKYVELDPDPSSLEIWDEAIQKADTKFSREMHNIFTNNCHSHVAHVLNLARYKGKTDWNMVDVWMMTFFKSKYVNPHSPLKIYLGFLFFILIIFLLSAI